MGRLAARGLSGNIDRLDQGAAIQCNRENVRPVPMRRSRAGTLSETPDQTKRRSSDRDAASPAQAIKQEVPEIVTAGTPRSPNPAPTPLTPAATPGTDGKFTAIRFLGRGAFADTYLVHKAKRRGSSGQAGPPVPAREYAKKIILCKSQNDQNKARAEAQAMAKLDHGAIVKIHKVYLLNSNSMQSVAIIMEFCELGDLDCRLNALMSARQTVDAESAQRWKLSLLEALEYIHKKVSQRHASILCP